jgi:cell division protein FtsB
MNKEKMFNRLAENAFDFLFKAISEIENQPKYSVIHFYAAVELFVKARLMEEHWSLVISQRQEADWGKFISGDFQSVTLTEAANKLKKVVRSRLSKAELDAFKKVANDRNKMVHFFHVAHSEEESDKFKRDIVKKQLKAWFFLHQLLITKWKAVFSSWEERISELDKELRKLHEFLQVIFDNLKPKIEENKKKGVLYEECPSCGFQAQELSEEKNTIYEAKCLVCGLVVNGVLKVRQLGGVKVHQ